MLTVFVDVMDLKHEYLTPSSTEDDFRAWLFQAVNFLGVIYTDFQFGCCNTNYGRDIPVTHSPAIMGLYQILLDVSNNPQIRYREISSCLGFMNGDLLYFQMEFLDE